LPRNPGSEVTFFSWIALAKRLHPGFNAVEFNPEHGTAIKLSP